MPAAPAAGSASRSHIPCSPRVTSTTSTRGALGHARASGGAGVGRRCGCADGGRRFGLVVVGRDAASPRRSARGAGSWDRRSRGGRAAAAATARAHRSGRHHALQVVGDDDDLGTGDAASIAWASASSRSACDLRGLLDVDAGDLLIAAWWPAAPCGWSAGSGRTTRPAAPIPRSVEQSAQVAAASSSPTTPMSVTRAPSARALWATLAAPPGTLNSSLELDDRDRSFWRDAAHAPDHEVVEHHVAGTTTCTSRIAASSASRAPGRAAGATPPPPLARSTAGRRPGRRRRAA